MTIPSTEQSIDVLHPDSSQLNVPVLFLIFNQPHITNQVFEAIRKVRPKRLFISADGPRHKVAGEKEECELTRAIVQRIDWDCEVKTNFRLENLGCKRAVSQGISWFFSHVEEGIILEYDTLPHPSFFYFCEKMLNRYRNHKQIMSISGSNFQLGNLRGDGRYYFSRIPSLWGWATWRDRWALWDGKVTGFETFRKLRIIETYFHNRRSCEFWLQSIERDYLNKSTAWGFAWCYAHFSNNGLAIVPNQNLVSNIGFGDQATHAKDRSHVLANLSKRGISEIVHPKFIYADAEADDFLSEILSREPLSVKLNKTIRKVAKTIIPEGLHFFFKKTHTKH